MKNDTTKKATVKKGTHGVDELKFEELNLQGQSRVINAQIQVLLKSIRANLRNVVTVEKRDRRRAICINLLTRGIERISKM